jgi:3-oxoacyl-[acyl-carrier-protein] synthase II
MGLTRQVVVTGIGVVSPIGIGCDSFWQSLCEGRSGVGRITQFDASSMPVPFGAELKDFDPKLHVKPRKSLKVMCREIQMAFAVADMAFSQAGIGADVPRERIGSIFGSQMLYGDVPEYADLYRSCMIDGRFEFERFGRQFASNLFPLWMLKYLPNMASCHIAIAHDARGPNNSIVLGEASSLLAIIEATQAIERDMADVMICGGTGSRLSLTGWMYRGDVDLSHRIEDPAAASRPYDLRRDGMVNGEGAAAFVLEELGHAQRRTARVLCRIAGHGRGMDIGQTSESRRTAIRATIRQAMGPTGVSAHDLGHVNGHGLSTIRSDAAEAQAIFQELGDVPVVGLKSYFGNLGSGGGAVELAASILAMQHSLVPYTLNYEYPDPDCPVNVIARAPLACQRRFALSLNQSGTGQCVSLLVEKALD